MKTVYIDEILDEFKMTQTQQQKRPRNWVAKHNFNRPVRHRDHTQYRRRDKHRQPALYPED